jgi:hypothetical protein
LWDLDSNMSLCRGVHRIRLICIHRKNRVRHYTMKRDVRSRHLWVNSNLYLSDLDSRCLSVMVSTEFAWFASNGKIVWAVAGWKEPPDLVFNQFCVNWSISDGQTVDNWRLVLSTCKMVQFSCGYSRMIRAISPSLSWDESSTWTKLEPQIKKFLCQWWRARKTFIWQILSKPVLRMSRTRKKKQWDAGASAATKPRALVLATKCVASSVQFYWLAKDSRIYGESSPNKDISSICPDG